MKYVYLIFAMLLLQVYSALGQKETEVQREYWAVYDLQKNTISNFEFFNTNYGMIGHDLSIGLAGAFWPRDSKNFYLFGGGFWFGAKKEIDGETKKIVTLTYNPSNGRFWFVPGSTKDSDTLEPDKYKKYRCYYSTDFYEQTGQVKDADDGPNWPYWITDTKKKYEFGMFKNEYVYDVDDRNPLSYTDGPLFVSDEDIVSIFKDTDLSQYRSDPDYLKSAGYPIGLQVESKIYSWGAGDLHDVVVQVYEIENISDDVIRDCWFSGVYDVEIGFYNQENRPSYSSDFVRYFDEDPSQNMVVAWSDASSKNADRGFGYMGLSFIETPAVDDEGFLRTDKLLYESSEQLGLVTAEVWNFVTDIRTSELRYDFISSGNKERNNYSEDIRSNIATGPFHLRPGEKASFAIAYVFAMPAKGGEADGTFEDLTGIVQEVGKDGGSILAKKGSLLRKLEIAREAYYTELVSSVSEEPNLSLYIKSVYPNPVSNKISIDFTNKLPGYCEIAIYDLNGKKVRSLMSGPLEAKRHLLDFQICNQLDNGAYVLKLTIGEESVSSKIMISH